eukprot:8930671-Alexandrium_andersonii.AAC.1
MSASLVGSEMCIRDRLRAGCPQLVLRQAGGRGPCQEAEVPSAGPDARPCLLYTSDAADDM